MAAALERVPRQSLVRMLLHIGYVQVTASGRALILTLLLVGTVSAAIGTQFPLHYLVFWMLSLLLVARVYGLLLRPRLEVVRALPRRCAAGAVITVQATVRNRGRWSAYDIGVGEAYLPWRPALSRKALRENQGLAVREPSGSPLIGRLGPGESARLSYRLQPTRRGLHTLPGPVAYSMFPFGLYRSGRRTPDPQPLLAYPMFVPLSQLDLPAGRKHQPGGLQLVSQVGDSEEYIGNREYLPGDRLRDIDHRAWARLGAPVVREFQQEYLTRIALVVDTYAPGRAGSRAFEAAISLGAAVADHLAREEYVVDLFAAGEQLYVFQSGRRLAYLDDVLDLLACIDSSPRDPFETLGPAVFERIGQLSTAVVVLLDWDETRRDFVRGLEAHGVRTKPLIVRAGATTLPESAGARRLAPEEVEQGVRSL